MKDFMAKVWNGVKWVSVKVWALLKWIWAKLKATALFIRDFITWTKNRGNPE